MGGQPATIEALADLKIAHILFPRRQAGGRAGRIRSSGRLLSPPHGRPAQPPRPCHDQHRHPARRSRHPPWLVPGCGFLLWCDLPEGVDAPSLPGDRPCRGHRAGSRAHMPSAPASRQPAGCASMSPSATTAAVAVSRRGAWQTAMKKPPGGGLIESRETTVRLRPPRGRARSATIAHAGTDQYAPCRHRCGTGVVGVMRSRSVFSAPSDN